MVPLSTILSTVLGSLAGIGLVGFGITWLFVRRHRLQHKSIQYINLREVSADDDALGVKVSSSKLTFGSYSSQIPVNEEVHDTLTITGVSHTPVEFQFELHDSPVAKCEITLSDTVGRVKRGEEFVLTVTLKALCTTTIDTPLMVIVPDQGFLTVKLTAESQLSTRLDPDEIKTGAVLGVGGYGSSLSIAAIFFSTDIFFFTHAKGLFTVAIGGVSMWQ